MRILCITQRFHPVIGGAEILTKSLMDHLSIKHEVVVYTSNGQDIESFWNKNGKKVSSSNSERYEIKRCEIVTPAELKFDKYRENFHLASNYPGPFLPQLWNDLVCNPINYDLIFTAAYPYDHIIPAYVAAKKWNLPIIIMPLLHQEFPELYMTGMRLTMLDNSDGIFVVSESEKKILTSIGIDNNKISILHPFINKKEWNDADPEKFKNNISLGSEKKIVLSAGSKAFVKGSIHLIEAMKVIWKRNNNVILVLLGPSTKEFDDYFSGLSNEIKNKIVDLGIVDTKLKKDAFAACDIMALPSTSESFGLVYLEAWFFEKPVIGCNIETTSEIIDHQKNGLLVEFGNVKELSNAILTLLNNPQVCVDYGRDGKNKITKLDAANILQNFENKCISVVNNFKNKKPV